MRLNWKNTFVIGLGFFGVSLVWPIYNSYMPLLYARFLPSKALIGGVMTIDNWLMLTLTPLIGMMSDRTRTRFGRRIPYLLVFAPLSALFLFLIPVGWLTGFWFLLIFTVAMNLSMASWRSPIVALMPDVTPSELRSKANGIINFMGGLGFVAATYGGSKLYRLNPGFPFYAVGVLLILVTLAFYFWIREPGESQEKSERIRLGKVTDRSALFLVLAILFWFIAYNAVETWLTTYGTAYQGLEAADVALLPVFSGGAFLLMAIPAGWISEGFRGWRGLGRKATILAGLVGMTGSYIGLYGVSDLRHGWLGILFVGVSWALVNINSYPMIAQMAGPGQVGAYTGLYYLASSLANIAGPPLFGRIFDTIGYQPFFPMAAGFMVLAFACMMFVKQGEAPQSTGDRAA